MSDIEAYRSVIGQLREQAQACKVCRPPVRSHFPFHIVRFYSLYSVRSCQLQFMSDHLCCWIMNLSLLSFYAIFFQCFDYYQNQCNGFVNCDSKVTKFMICFQWFLCSFCLFLARGNVSFVFISNLLWMETLLTCPPTSLLFTFVVQFLALHVCCWLSFAA